MTTAATVGQIVAGTKVRVIDRYSKYYGQVGHIRYPRGNEYIVVFEKGSMEDHAFSYRQLEITE